MEQTERSRYALTEGMICLYHFSTTSMYSIMHSRLKKRPLQRRENGCLPTHVYCL